MTEAARLRRGPERVDRAPDTNRNSASLTGRSAGAVTGYQYCLQCRLNGAFRARSCHAGPRAALLCTRRFTAAGSSLAFAGCGELLTLPFEAMLLRCGRWKSGGPALLKPSLKVKRDTAHHGTPGCRPGLKDHNARGPRKVHPTGSAPACTPDGRQMSSTSP